MACATLHRESRPLRKLPKRLLPPATPQLGASTCSTLNATFGNGSPLEMAFCGVEAFIESGKFKFNVSSALSPALGFDNSYTGLLKLSPVVCTPDSVAAAFTADDDDVKSI